MWLVLPQLLRLFLLKAQIIVNNSNEKPTTIDGLINLAEHVYLQIKHPELAPNGIKITNKEDFLFALENVLNKKLDTPEAFEKGYLALRTIQELNKVDKKYGEAILLWALPKDGSLQNEKERTPEALSKWRKTTLVEAREFFEKNDIDISSESTERKEGRFVGDLDPRTLYPKDISENSLRISLDSLKKILPTSEQNNQLFSDIDRVFGRAPVTLINVETTFYNS